MVPVTGLRERYRYASGGSSVGGVLAVENALLGEDEAHLDGGERAEDGVGSPESGQGFGNGGVRCR